MDKKCLSNLKTHITQIACSFINQITPENVIYSLEGNGKSRPDPVSNHHLIELLCELDSGIFHHYSQSLLQWLINPSNGFTDHPFALGSYTLLCDRNNSNNGLFRRTIVDKQLKDGSIPVFTSMIEGGDFFSTLWATKILVNYDKEYFSEDIKKAIDYLIQRESIASKSISQSGFLFYILLRYNPAKYERTIFKYLGTVVGFANHLDFEGSLINLVDGVYLIEDLVEYLKWKEDREIKKLVDSKVRLLFQLNKEPSLPKVFSKWSDYRPQSLYFQSLLRSAYLGARFLNLFYSDTLALETNAFLHINYRKVKYIGLKSEVELEKYKTQYGAIEAEFNKYDAALKNIWELTDSNYEHSIFLMMPFKSDLDYRATTDIIKQTSKKLGLKAFRVDDEHRKPFDTLWDNIVLNMLACKYGISIYVSEKSIDKLTDEVKFFENPNVALEFGFMKSRGKKVLILKDKGSKTPSDLQGFQWKQFDIRNPDKTIPKVLKTWLTELKEVNERKATKN